MIMYDLSVTDVLYNFTVAMMIIINDNDNNIVSVYIILCVKNIDDYCL